MTTFTDTWNSAFEDSPADSDDVAEGAARIREERLAVRERLEVQHSWAGDANDGVHKIPYFHAIRSSGQNISGAIPPVAIQFNTEVLDSNNWYNTSTYRFTPQVAGKYLITVRVYMTGSDGEEKTLYIYKNGVAVASFTYTLQAAPDVQGGSMTLSSIVSLNGSTDYVHAYMGSLTADTFTLESEGSVGRNAFFGYFLSV